MKAQIRTLSGLPKLNGKTKYFVSVGGVYLNKDLRTYSYMRLSTDLQEEGGTYFDTEKEAQALADKYNGVGPKLWRDMTPEEKGALLLAHHEGKRIQIYTNTEGWYTFEYGVTWADDCAYRVKPEPVKPVVETVEVYGGKAFGYWSFGSGSLEDDTHKITLTLIDGEVQPTATVEEI